MTNVHGIGPALLAHPLIIFGSKSDLLKPPQGAEVQSMIKQIQLAPEVIVLRSFV